MVTISTSTDTIRPVEKIRIDTALKLTDDSWVEQPSLFLDRLSVVSAPDIDTAEFQFNYGIYADQERVAPLSSLSRQYVRIILRDADNEPDNPTATQMMDQAFLVWYGVIEVDDRDIGGTRIINGVAVPTGNQKLTAFGLLRELELTFVNRSVVENSDGTFQTIERGIPFNIQSTSQFPDRGNSTAANGGESNTTRIFSNAPFTDADGSRWNALTALQYTLEYDVPADINGVRVFEWQLAGEASLDWFNISIERDGRPVKDIIDDLLDRRRLTGYYVQGVEDIAGFHAELRTYSFNDSTLNLDGSHTLLQNPRQFTLDFENSFDIENAELSDNSAHRADIITIRGAFITSTFSCWIANNFLEEGWTEFEEITFKDAAKNVAGYVGLDEEQKQKLNQVARTADSLRDVFAKFVIGDAWDHKIPDSIDGGGETYFATVRDLPFPGEVNMRPYFGTLQPGVFPGNLWHGGRTFLRYIPIREQDEKDLSDYRDPFVIFRTPVGGATWEFGHQLNAKSSFEDDDDVRQFSTRMTLLDKELGFRVEVGAAGGQQLIALNDWAAAETTKKEYDPLTPEGNGVNFKDMIATVTIEWDDRIEAVALSPDPDESPVLEGRMLREMFFDLPDARLDFILPGTVTDIDDAGALIQESLGKIQRDDRDRISRVALVAKEWYGRKRQAFRLRYKQVRPPTDGTEIIRIGDLITSLGTSSVYADPEVNSVVTSIIFELTGSPTTTIETSFAHLDVANVF